MKKIIQLFGIVCSAFLMVSCTIYSQNKLQIMENLAASGSAQPPYKSLYLRVTGEHAANGTSRGMEHIEKLENPVIDAYKKSGLFGTVRTEKAVSDLYADVVVTINEDFSTPGVFICGFTLTIIPCSSESTVSMKTTFKDAEGKIITKIEKQEKINIWIQFFLIFATPFNVTDDEIMASLVRSTLNEAHSKSSISF